MTLSTEVGFLGHRAGLWRVYLEKSLHSERTPFTAVNFPKELADNKATWKCKKNKEEEGGGSGKEEEEKEKGEINPLKAVNPTDSRAVNMNSI